MATRKTEQAQSTTSETVITNLDEARAKKLTEKIDLATALLLPNPETLNTAGEQICVDVVSKLEPIEYFRAHPTIRLTLNLYTPNREDLDSQEHAVMPDAVPMLARHKQRPYLATLYPIAIGTQPLTYKLFRVKHPPIGRKWDKWNLSRKLACDRSVDEWIALRSIPGAGYEWVAADPKAVFPPLVFPKRDENEWEENEWLMRSFGAQDLILTGDEDHPVFRALRGL